MKSNKILIIAEIEGLFCYTQRPKDLSKNFSSQTSTKPDIQTAQHSIKLRPFVHHLTDLIFNRYANCLELAIWSSLTRNDCIPITKSVLGKNAEK